MNEEKKESGGFCPAATSGGLRAVVHNFEIQALLLLFFNLFLFLLRANFLIYPQKIIYNFICPGILE